MFLKNEMCPDFEWKKYVKKKNPYWKKWGFDISGLDAAYYGKLSGIEADHYVTRSMAVHFIYPYLDRYDFVPAYMDKNVQKSILGLPDAELGVMAAEDVVYNANGVFYTGDGKECSGNQSAGQQAHGSKHRQGRRRLICRKSDWNTLPNVLRNSSPSMT